MRFQLRPFLVTAVLAATVLSAATTVAAPVSWQKMDLTLHSERSGSVMLMSGDLPASAKLPAEATFVVPKGSEVQWLGEILGGPPANDPELKYTKVTKKDTDVYTFTMTKARTAQIEIPTSEAPLFDGTSYKPSLKWTASQDTPEIALRVRIPREVQIAAPVAGATLQAGDAGYSMYSKTFTNVEAGDKLDLTFAYTLTAAPASSGAGASRSSTDTTTLVIIVALLVAAFGLLALKVRGTQTPTSEDATEEEDEPQRKQRASAPSESADEVAKPAKKVKPAYVVLGVVGALVIGTVIAANSGTSARIVDGKIKKSFGATSP